MEDRVHKLELYPDETEERCDQYDDDEQEWYDSLEPLDPFGDDDDDYYYVYYDYTPARFWECELCDGGRFACEIPCELCEDTGLRWRWARQFAAVYYWLRAYWQRIFAHCPSCMKLEFVAGKRVGKHDDCCPF